MATSHDITAYNCLRIFLDNFRSGFWKNDLFSNDLELRRTNKNWPSEDGNVFDSSNNLSIALEFKPDIETKRGIQTGLGQCLTYLERYSSSYFLCPKTVEGFEISSYMRSVFENSIFGKVPVGLIQHNRNQETGELNLEMLVDIDSSFTVREISETSRESRYWAKYIDTNPHLIYLLLKIANDINYHGNDRDHKIWGVFFDDYYFPKNKRDLQPFESEISHWGIKYMEPYRDKKKALKKLVDIGEIEFEEALYELHQHCCWEGAPILSRSTQGDNLYKSYKKNYLKALDHLELWDENCYLTDLGNSYLDFGNYHGPDSIEMKYFFGKMFLEQGNHFDLIMDLTESVKEKSFDTEREARIYSQQFMESKGLYKRNRGRAVTSGNTKIFQNEFQLWRKLEILPARNSYLNGKGYQFDWDKIDQYLNFNI